MNYPSKKRVHIQIIDFIKGQVKDRVLIPGSRLPSERVLAEQLNVSRTSIKEAFVVMQSAGLIEIKQGSGARLLEDNTDNVLLKINMIVNQTSTNIVDLMELRQSVECEATSLAAVRRSEEDLGKIKAALTNLEQAVKRKELAAKEDLDFHLSIAKASRNLLFVEVMYLLSERILKALAKSREETMQQPGRSELIFEEHDRIFKAIQDGNVEMARQTMNDHLNNVKKRYL